MEIEEGDGRRAQVEVIIVAEEGISRSTQTKKRLDRRSRRIDLIEVVVVA